MAETDDNKAKLSFNDDFEVQAPLSFEEPVSDQTGDFKRPVNADTYDRAQKFDFALGENSPGIDVLYRSATDGTEKYVRQNAVANVHSADEILKKTLVSQYLSSTEGLNAQDSEHIQFLQGLYLEPPKDPEQEQATILERLYGRAAVSAAVTFDEDDSVFNEALIYDEDGFHQLMDRTDFAIAKQMYAQDLMEEAESRYSKIDTFSRVGQFVFSNFIPFWQWGSTYNATGWGTNNFLMGNNIQEQVETFGLLPLEEATKGLREAFEAIWARNPDDAMYFLRAFQGMDSWDVSLGNFVSVADMAAVGGSIPALRAARALKNVGKTALAKRIRPTDIKIAAGDINGAAIHAGTTEVGKISPSPSTADEIKIATPSIHDPESIMNPGANNGFIKESARRVYESLQRTAKEFTKQIIDQPVAIDRLPEDVLQTAYREAEMDFRGEHRMIEDRIMNVRNYGPETVEGNIGMIGVMLGKARKFGRSTKFVEDTVTDASSLGKKVRGKKLEPVNDSNARKRKRTKYDPVNAMKHKPGVKEIHLTPDNDVVGVQMGRQNARPFDSVEEAKRDAELLGLTEYNIAQVGTNKFAIEVTRTINETSDAVRNDLAFHLSKNPTPKTALSSLLDKVRTPKETMHRDITRSMDTAVMGTSGLQPFIEQIRSSIGTLPKASRERLRTFMNRQAMYKKNPSDIPGKFSKDHGEFERDWMREFGVTPTEKESLAYWHTVQISDMDLVVRNMTRYKQMARIGAREYSFQVGDLAFDGVQARYLRDGLPLNLAKGENSVDAQVLILDDTAGGGRPPNVKRLRNMRHRSADEIADPSKRNVGLAKSNVVEDFYDGGYQVLHVPDFSEEAMKEVLKANGVKGAETLNFDYVMVRDPKSRNLKWQQIPRRGGGHHIYQDGTFIAQPKLKQIKSGNTVVQNKYYGDKNMYFVPNGTDPDEFVKRFNIARELLRDGKTASLRKYLKKNLPFTLKEFEARFAPGFLDPDIPVFARPSGSSLDDHVKLSEHFPNFVKSSDNPHNFYKNSVNWDFAMERGETLDTVVRQGSEENPFFKFQPTNLMDAQAAINRTTQSMLKGVYLDDLKYKFAERFIAEFGPFLKMTPEEYRSNPIKALLHGEFRDGADIDRDMLMMANIYRNNARRFFNVMSENHLNINYTINKASQSISGKDAVTGETMWIWNEADPAKFTRKAAYHLNFGFFNPAQYPLQASGAFLSIAIDPLRGLSAAVVNIPQSWAIRNAKSLDHIASGIGKIIPGWTKETFKEATEGLIRSRFMNVGGEQAAVDDWFAPSLTGQVGKFEKGSSYFMRKGEQVNRHIAWNTSYLRWRHANPTAKFDDVALSKVLAGAEDLSGNMTSASNAAWQEGWPGVTTSYWTYNVRLMELFTGKRLSVLDKGRMFAMYGAMFGLTGSFGLTPLGLLPLQDWLKEYLNANGINVEDNILLKGFTEGFGSVMLDMTTGGEYDWSGRFGPGNFSFIADLFDTEGKTTFEWLMGISGTTVANTLLAAGSILASSIDVFRPEQEQWEVTDQDFLDFLSTIGAGRSALRAYYGFKYGQYRTKRGETVDVTPSETLVMSLSGTLPDRISNAYAIINNEKTRREATRKARNEAIKNLRLSAQAKADGDEDNANLFYKRAHLAMMMADIPPMQYYEVFKQAFGDRRDLLESAELLRLKHLQMKEAGETRRKLQREKYGRD